jgi:hypothetical protein
MSSEVGNSLKACRNSGRKFRTMATLFKLRPLRMLLTVSANLGRDSSWWSRGSEMMTTAGGTSQRIVLLPMVRSVPALRDI